MNNDFDDIINRLDTWLDRKSTDGSPDTKRPSPPRFNPGDVVRIKETRYPPKTADGRLQLTALLAGFDEHEGPPGRTQGGPRVVVVQRFSSYCRVT